MNKGVLVGGGLGLLLLKLKLKKEKMSLLLFFWQIRQIQEHIIFHYILLFQIQCIIQD